MLERKLLLCVILKLCLSAIYSAVIFKDFSITYRLSNESIPLNYFIHLETDIHTGTNFNYTGYVIIDINIVRNTRILRLHQRAINVGTVELRDSENNELPIIEIIPTVEYDFLDIVLDSELKATDEIYKLKISFVAPLRSFAQGFYRSYYIDEDGEHWLAATQFESTNARYAFPCYDEPGLKATFELEIKHHSNYTAISNNPGTRTIIDDAGYVITKFDKTLNMSTYLLAFLVSDYISEDNLSATPKQSVYTRPNVIKHTKLALIEGVNILKALEDYIGITYNLDKLDQATIPDFQPGAMENWGLVTYKETLLLFNEENGTLKQKLDVITTIAHEYGHQFFGNLVSPKWWEFIWLNEGFATLMEYYLPHLLYPTERYMDLFVINRLQYAMTVDGLKNTRPMTHYAESPSSISGLFDTIAYHKSGSILRMIQHFLTDETFKKGLRLYLETCKFNVAVPNDLFKAFVEVNQNDNSVSTEYDLYAILESWTLQKGYPLLTVTRHNDEGIVTLSQQQFLYDKDNEKSKQLWIIPFTYYTTNTAVQDPLVTYWMPNQAEYELQLSLKESEWMILNIGQSGYYRVNYDVSNWELIINYLNDESNAFEKIGPINRAQLIDDSFNLARAGIIPYDIPLRIIQYLSTEFDYIPWAAAYTNLRYLNGVLEPKSKVSQYWIQFLNQLSNNTIQKIGYTPKDNDSNFDILLRSLVLDLSCKLGNEECIEFMRSERTKYFNTQHIDHNLKEHILCYGQDINSYNEILGLLLSNANVANDQAEQDLVLEALGCVEDENLLLVSLLITLLETSNLRSAHRNRIFTSVLSKTDYGLDVTIDFVSYNYEEIQRLYSGNNILDKLIVNMASYVRTEDEAAKFELNLLNHLQNILDESTIEAAKNIYEERLLWQSEYGEQVKTFLWTYFDVEGEEEEEENQSNDDDNSASNVSISIVLLLAVQFIIQIHI